MATHDCSRVLVPKTAGYLERERLAFRLLNTVAVPISPVPSSNIVVGSGTLATGPLTLFGTGSKVTRPVPGLMDWIDLMDSIDAPPNLPGMTLKFPL